MKKELSIEDYIELGKLEEAGDKLIELWNAVHVGEDQSDEYPACSERDMVRAERRRMRELSIEDVFDATVSQLPTVDALFEVVWCEIRSGAAMVGCTDRQIEILSWRRYGLSCNDISDVTGYSISTVKRDLKIAAKKIQHIKAFGLWSVLAEVFQVDVGFIKSLILSSRKK